MHQGLWTKMIPLIFKKGILGYNYLKKLEETELFPDIQKWGQDDFSSGSYIGFSKKNEKLPKENAQIIIIIFNLSSFSF